MGQHFSPSWGRVRDDVACPERCPITRITTGTTYAQPQSPGTRCKPLSLSLSIARNKDKHCSSHPLHTRQPAAFVSNSNGRQLLTVWQLHILPAVGYKKHGHRVPGPWQGLFFSLICKTANNLEFSLLHSYKQASSEHPSHHQRLSATPADTKQDQHRGEETIVQQSQPFFVLFRGGSKQ